IMGAGPTQPVESGQYFPTVGVSFPVLRLKETLPEIVNRVHDFYNVTWLDYEHQTYASTIMKIATFHLEIQDEQFWVYVIISNAQLKYTFIPMNMSCDISIAVSSAGQSGNVLVNSDSVSAFFESTQTEKIINDDTLRTGDRFRSWLDATLRILENIALKIAQGFDPSTPEIFLYIDRL
ncbi:hypothetical protein HY570_02375, partial [Candidatus Micrarchaeota archaeon]|nr:hypothetical protein [Candidatus Micrarchaeota archaeon]